MVKINVEELRSEVNKIDKLITSYEDNIGNINMCYQNIASSWRGGVFDEKNKELEQEILSNKKLISRLKEQQAIYEDIFNFYKNIGNNITCNLNSKDYTLSKIQINIDNIKTIKNKINELTPFIDISQELNIINETLNSINEVKSTIRNLYQDIEDKEYEIYNKVSKNITE